MPQPWLAPPSLSAVSLALAVGLLSYLAGRRSRWLVSGSARSGVKTAIVCECGAKLGGATANDFKHHLRSRRHATNMRLATGVKVLVTENWAEYRSCIESCVGAEDAVLEIGCARGVTTALLASRASRVVGLDASAKVVGMARERHPQLQFEVGAAEDIGAIKKLGDFAVIFLDINGSRELGTVVPLLERYDAALASHGLRLIVVKNARLKRLMLKTRCAGDGGDELGAGDGGDELGAHGVASQRPLLGGAQRY